MPRTALLAGATGFVGEQLIRRLVVHPEYGKVIAVSRRAPDDDSRVTWVPSDFSDLGNVVPLLRSEQGGEHAYCCLGTTHAKGGYGGIDAVDYEMVVDFARAAHRAGATRFTVLSAVGASRFSPSHYARTKASMERAVAKIGFEKVVILRPSLFVGAREAEFRFWEDFWMNTVFPFINPVLMGPLQRYRSIKVDDVAAAMVAATLRPGLGVQTYYLPLPPLPPA